MASRLWGLLRLCSSKSWPSDVEEPSHIKCGLKLRSASDGKHGMKKRFQRLFAIVQKETIQMLRDRPTLLMVLLLPVVELFLFAYAGNMTLDHLPTAVADMSMDTRSRAFVNALEVSGFFDIELRLESEEQVVHAIETGAAGVGVVLPPDFSSQVERGDAQALVILDGSDSFMVQSSYAAVNAVAQALSIGVVVETAERMGVSWITDLPISTSIRILYNPNIDSIVFLVPGLAAMLLQLVAVNATAMAVVRERELGTMEQTLVTPIRPVELIVGKMTPAILLTAVNLLIIMLFGVYWFGIPFRGSVWQFGGLSLLFIISGVGLGLMISTWAKNQKQAQQMTGVILMLTMLLTGLVYPRSTMPPVIRAIGNLVPATYFMRIARGIITKGVGITFVLTDVLALVIYGIVVIAIAAATFKKRLD